LDVGQSIIYQKLLSLSLASPFAAVAAAAAAFAAHFARETEE